MRVGFSRSRQPTELCNGICEWTGNGCKVSRLRGSAPDVGVGRFGDKRSQRENFGRDRAYRSPELLARSTAVVADSAMLVRRRRISVVGALAEGVSAQPT